MHRGYIKLWRRVFDSGIQKEHATFTMWIWILGNVTHKTLKYIARGQKIELQPGELIIGRKKLAMDLRLSEQKVRTCLHHLELWGNITIRSTKRYSILKVNNWELYQDSDNQINQQPNQELTINQPSTNQELTTKQECKNVKNVRIKKESVEIPDWINQETWEAFKEFRIRIKAPLTNRAIQNIIKELEKLKSDGQEPNSVLDQSITRGWRGIFPLRSDKQPGEMDVDAWTKRILQS